MKLFKNKNKEAILERRPLPIGAGEFDEWADRLIQGAMLPADHDSQKFALATMIMHLGPTEDFKEDAFFIHQLRKSAVNQVAAAKMEELRNAAKARLAAKELEATQKESLTDEVLGDGKVQEVKE